MIINRGGINVDKFIRCMVVTPDSKYLFTGGDDKKLCQYSIPGCDLVKNYGEVHLSALRCMAITHDGKYLFTGSSDGYLKQWAIPQRKLYKDYGNKPSNSLLSMITFQSKPY